MADDKSKRGSPDNRLIDVNDANEVRNWSESFGVTADELKAAVGRVGTSAEKVREALKKR
jgi:hypothetical protein